MDDITLKNDIMEDKKTVMHSKKYKEQKSELRETENVRQESLKQLKEWIRQNRDIENCLTDDNFLGKFLRVRKYSIPMAQQTLLKYLNFRQKFNSVMMNLDYTDDRTIDLINRGYIFVSPYRDCNGRRVIFYNFSSLDLRTVTGLDIQRADAVTFETLLEEEECQVMGVTHVIQAGNVGPSVVPLFCTKDFGYLIKWGEQSFPMRHKAFIITNVSGITKYIFESTKGLISAKLRDRIWMDESAEKLSALVGEKCLPLELGGKIPAQKMIDLWKIELASKRNRLMSLDTMKLLSDKGIITRRNLPRVDETGSGNLSGSFRKLEID